MLGQAWERIRNGPLVLTMTLSSFARSSIPIASKSKEDWLNFSHPKGNVTGLPAFPFSSIGTHMMREC